MYGLIAKLVYDEMNNYRCIKKEYSGTYINRTGWVEYTVYPIQGDMNIYIPYRVGGIYIQYTLQGDMHIYIPYRVGGIYSIPYRVI